MVRSKKLAVRPKQPVFTSKKAVTSSKKAVAGSKKSMISSKTSLLSLPRDILVLLPDFLHNIEDFTNLSSTCLTLYSCLVSTPPNTILRLAAAQANVFFRPSPHMLVAATARELGDWARQSESNEYELATQMQGGYDALLELALEHCGLTVERIRELHRMRFDIINPVTDIIDKCVGQQWSNVPGFWYGARSDAYTIDADANDTFFHLAIYGELFGPDFDPFLYDFSSVKRLKVETRIEYIKYCVPDFSCEQQGHIESDDPLRAVNPVGPYRKVDPNDPHSFYADLKYNNNLALTWVLKSSRWKPLWKQFRAMIRCNEFVDDLKDKWWYDEQDPRPEAWRQRMLENVMMCQGLEGLGMVSPALSDRSKQGSWLVQVREWRERIAIMDDKPDNFLVGKQATMESPYLLGDLRCCASGYVSGT